VNNPSLTLKIVLLVAFLAGCASAAEDKRYHDTMALERPPTLVFSKKDTATPVFDDSGAPEEVAKDNSVIRKKSDKTGLGDKVSLVEQEPTPQTNEDIWAARPSQLIIKQTYDEAWNSLGLALKQSDIEITDHDHEKGLYFVSYDADPSLFSSKNSNNAIYVLTVKREGAETKVTAALGNATEQNSAGNRGKKRGAPKDNSTSQPSTGPEDLLKQVFEMLRDDLKEE
jgi:uncharacterized lipoprotein